MYAIALYNLWYGSIGLFAPLRNELLTAVKAERESSVFVSIPVDLCSRPEMPKRWRNGKSFCRRDTVL